MAASVQSRVTSLAEELRPVLLRLARQLRRESRGTGLSPLDSQLIATIKHNKGIGVSELAELEQMTAPTMSAHVKRLEEAGLIARDASACGDKRRTSLAITREGEKALEAVRRRRNDWLAARLSELNEKELQSLLSAIAPLAHLAGESF
ncbi:MAG: MarR family transcriptional regulator [Alphaproteobacteria bacterium]